LRERERKETERGCLSTCIRPR